MNFEWTERESQVSYRFKNRLLRRNAKRFRVGLVCKAHILVHQSTLGLRVVKKKKSCEVGVKLSWHESRIDPEMERAGTF